MRRKCTYSSHKGKPAKLWHFLWHEDGWLSFMADAVLVVLIGKFILLPVLGAMMGTAYPLVAVVSSSMDHQDLELDKWWDKNGNWYEQNSITKEEFKQFYRVNGFKKGDALVIKGRSVSELEVGDIIVYSVGSRPEPIIHRIVDISEDGDFVTKGDANSGQLLFEHNVKAYQIEGEAVFWVPYIGWPKTIFVKTVSALN